MGIATEAVDNVLICYEQFKFTVNCRKYFIDNFDLY